MRTTRTTALPPFYTQVIGSLPRPLAVRDLLARREALPAADFTAAMDDMIAFAIRLQETAGLDVVSDGEWRRAHYVGEFLQRVGGFARVRRFDHQGETKFTDVVVGAMAAGESVFARDAAFLARHTDRVTKFALPSPFLIVTRYWHEDYSRDAYPTPRHFLDHLTALLTAEAQAVAAAGIDIVQFDDPALTYYCDRALQAGEHSHDERLRRQWDPDREIADAVAALNAIAAGLPVETHLHCCHSVYKRRSDVTGDYKPLLPRLAALQLDRLNLEFAYHGTGQADDLALLPPQLSVGMGVVDVRTDQLQSTEAIADLARAGAAYLPPTRIALNPDCGFAPDAGEPPSIDEAYEKLARLCQAAKIVREAMDRSPDLC